MKKHLVKGLLTTVREINKGQWCSLELAAVEAGKVCLRGFDGVTVVGRYGDLE